MGLSPLRKGIVEDTGKYSLLTPEAELSAANPQRQESAFWCRLLVLLRSDPQPARPVQASARFFNVARKLWREN